jgi:hypothetical protein
MTTAQVLLLNRRWRAMIDLAPCIENPSVEPVITGWQDPRTGEVVDQSEAIRRLVTYETQLRNSTNTGMKFPWFPVQ